MNQKKAEELIFFDLKCPTNEGIVVIDCDSLSQKCCYDTAW